MSGFASQTLERKLVDLNNSQQSIQTLSLWLIHHRKHHKAIVQTWFAELKKAKPSRRLTFMYLANDVIQNSRKKGPEFSKEFGAVLKASFEVVAKDSDDKTLASLERILSIWETRVIYDANQISSFKSSLTLRKNQTAVKEEKNSTAENNSSVPVKSKEKEKEKPAVKPKDKEKEKQHKKEHHKHKDKDKHSEKNSKESKKRMHDNSKGPAESKKRALDDPKASALIQNSGKSKLSRIVEKLDNKPTPIIPLNTGAPVDSETLIKALQDLENSASADASVRQKIASLPNEVFDATLLEKIRDKGSAERLTKLVDEARQLLNDYNSRLTQELEERKHISNILSTFTQNQRVALSAAEHKLLEYKEKLRKVVQVRNELKSHLQNLPDLSRLPSVTGLAPLPSACDLFNVARIGHSAESVSSSVSPNESYASPVDNGTPGSNTSL